MLTCPFTGHPINLSVLPRLRVVVKESITPIGMISDILRWTVVCMSQCLAQHFPSRLKLSALITLWGGYVFKNISSLNYTKVQRSAAPLILTCYRFHKSGVGFAYGSAGMTSTVGICWKTYSLMLVIPLWFCNSWCTEGRCYSSFRGVVPSWPTVMGSHWNSLGKLHPWDGNLSSAPIALAAVLHHLSQGLLSIESSQMRWQCNN